MGRLAVTGALAAAATAAVLLTAPAAAQSGAIRVDGTLTALEIYRADDRLSPGVIVVGDQRVAVPSTVLIELPGDAMTLQDLWTRAPAQCRALHETGLVPADACRRPPRPRDEHDPVWTVAEDRTPRTYLDPVPTDEAPPTTARVTAERRGGGELVATRVALTRTDTSVWGAVTFVNEDEGYLRINGAFGIDQGGALMRINDPDARQSMQHGTGCGTEGNCSPDARFRANSREASVRFDAGYRACVPGGLGAACAGDTRPVRGALDGNVMVPIARGDHVTAQGGFEVHDGTRVFWAHQLFIHTSPGGEP